MSGVKPLPLPQARGPKRVQRHMPTRRLLADFSATPIGSGTAPFAGIFALESPLSAQNGHSRSGTWKLPVAGLASVDIGMVLCWYRLRPSSPSVRIATLAAA